MRNESNSPAKSLPKGLLEENVPYAFTINLEKQYFKRADDLRPQLCTLAAHKLLSQYSRYIKYELYPEISKFGSRWHYHGVLIIRDNQSVEFALRIHNLTAEASLKIDIINNIDEWAVYCAKDEHSMRPFCEKRNLPYPLFHNTLYPPLNKHTDIPYKSLDDYEFVVSAFQDE